MKTAPTYLLETGTRVTTTDNFDPNDTLGMLISSKYLDVRAKNKPGTISGVFGGHGGDVYAVDHEDGTVGAYCWSEFEVDTPCSTHDVSSYGANKC